MNVVNAMRVSSTLKDWEIPYKSYKNISIQNDTLLRDVFDKNAKVIVIPYVLSSECLNDIRNTLNVSVKKVFYETPNEQYSCVMIGDDDNTFETQSKRRLLLMSKIIIDLNELTSQYVKNLKNAKFKKA